MKVVFSPAAKDDLMEIAIYIAQDNPVRDGSGTGGQFSDGSGTGGQVEQGVSSHIVASVLG